MIHNVRFLQRRFPQYARGIFWALLALSLLALGLGLFLLLA
ncbi:MAG TPA: hypothetical protein VMT16_10115 [Thermoanaerobaculia bacterium]|nr:hypothetical protein [Thermoanaerobaculia bacterium]